MATTDGKHRLLIAGGGVAALEAMVALRELAGELVEVELVSPDLDFFYRPLSVAEPFGVGNVLRFDLPTLARGCGAPHRLGSLVAVYPDRHRVRTGRNTTIDYDSLLIAAGARPREAVPGALTFRGEVDVARIAGMLSDLNRGVVRQVVFALPGSVTWPLPLLAIAGLPQDDDFFVAVDESCRVVGLEDVYAAGDITTFPVKQGGLAAQQADVAAAGIAAAAGATVAPEPFEPVLRGLLLSSSPLFLRTELGGGHGEVSTAESDALWWPAAKIASRYLSPYLAERAGLAYGPRGGPVSVL
jgi:NADH dehydrogenase FAD-containing subunit